MATPLTDQQLLEVADKHAPYPHAKGEITERRPDAVVVTYTHHGPGGRKRSTVVTVNLDGTIAGAIAQ